MVYNNAGGKNKTHQSTNKYRKIDSFKYNYLRQYTDNIYVFLNGSRQSIEYETVNNNFNEVDSPKRIYFICPNCSNRVRYLYVQNGLLKCRVCAKLNYPSQQRTKDYREKQVKRMRTILDKLNYHDGYMTPHTMCIAYPDKPHYMHYKTYNKLINELQQAKNNYLKNLESLLKAVTGKLDRIHLDE